MQQNNVAETLIGAVVVVVAIAFLAFAYLRTGSGSLSGYELNVRLSKADGLGIGQSPALAVSYFAVAGILFYCAKYAAFHPMAMDMHEVPAEAD